MDATSARMKRIDDAKQNRSDAINRFMATSKQKVADAKTELRLYQGLVAFIALVAVTTIVGWQ
jgi:hypothetical protein